MESLYNVLFPPSIGLLSLDLFALCCHQKLHRTHTTLKEQYQRQVMEVTSLSPDLRNSAEVHTG